MPPWSIRSLVVTRPITIRGDEASTSSFQALTSTEGNGHVVEVSERLLTGIQLEELDFQKAALANDSLR